MKFIFMNFSGETVFVKTKYGIDGGGSVKCIIPVNNSETIMDESEVADYLDYTISKDVTMNESDIVLDKSLKVDKKSVIFISLNSDGTSNEFFSSLAVKPF